MDEIKNKEARALSAVTFRGQAEKDIKIKAESLSFPLIHSEMSRRVLVEERARNPRSPE